MTPEDYQRFLEDRFRSALGHRTPFVNAETDARLKEREAQLKKRITNPSSANRVTSRIDPKPINRRVTSRIDPNAANFVKTGAKSKPFNRPTNSGPGVGRALNSSSGKFLDIPTTPQSGSDKLADIKSQLEALFNKPDIPGYWESPVSQGYLNQLGNQFNQAGTSAQVQLEAAKQEIIDNYANTGAQRANENQAFTNELVGGLQNLGINTGDSAMLDRAQTDAAYLDQVAAQNQATDTSFNTKLGENAALLGQQLAMMAREGLLHPKQWIPGQSGMSDGDRLRAQFLMDEYGTERDLASALLDDGVTQEAEEDFVHKNPMFAESLGTIQDPALRDYIQTQYDAGGGNIQDALKNLSETGTIPQNPFESLLGNMPTTGVRFLDNAAGLPSPEMIQQAIQEKYNNEVLGPWNKEQQLAQQATEFFRRLSPYYQGLITERNMTDSYKG